MRSEVTPPYEILMVVGAASAVLFLVAVVGVWQWRPWSPRLLVALASVDIVGEFVAQGTLAIDLVLSFVVALALLVLAWRARARYREATEMGGVV